jgi:hypothetical protein
MNYCKTGQTSKAAVEPVLLCNLMRIIIIAFQFSRNPSIFASDIDQAFVGATCLVWLQDFAAV